VNAPDIWGRTAGGEDVLKLDISGGGLSATIISWGATVQDLRLDGHTPPLVLGFQRFEDYPAYSPYFGATAGRVANRIGAGRFTIDGVVHEVERNLDGRHTLHSGKQGIGKRNWRLAEFGSDFARLEIIDPDGFAGFPGSVTISNEYRLEDGALKVKIQAVTDAPTLVNIAHHSYFNLEDGGATDCLDHAVKIAAEAITELDGDLIPSGALVAVAGTPYDFRNFAPLRRETSVGPFAHDINYCVSAARVGLRPVAWAKAARSGVALEVLSTEPGMQLYTGSKIGGRPAHGLTGQPYAAFAGFCFEAQCWPDAPNHPHFPSILLRPGETYAQETWYCFEKA
jgi:aldose 1-epimerase